MTDGPTEYTQPTETYKSCSGCSHYDRRMVKSGSDPIYASNCNNPDIPLGNKLTGNTWRGNLPDGSRTPDWCPFLNVEKLT